MKKLFVLLLALSCVGFVFAEDAAPALKLTGKIYGAIDVVKAGEEDAQIVMGRSADSGYEEAWRTRINGAYTDGDYGMNFRLQAGGSTAPTFTRTFAWANFFGGMLNVKAGYLYEGGWMTQGDAAFGEIDSKGGFSLSLKPVEALTAGAYVPVTTTYALLEDAFKNIQLGAAYSVEGIGDFEAGYLGSAIDDQSDIFVGFNLTAVENLSAQVEFMLGNLGAETDIAKIVAYDVDTLGFYQIVETVEYAMEPLTVGFIGYQTLYTADDAALGMSLNPYVEYAMGTVSLGLDFVYNIVNSLDQDDDSDTPDIVLTEDMAENVGNGYEITPYVAFALGNNTLKVGAHIGEKYAEIDDTNYTEAFAYFEWAF